MILITFDKWVQKKNSLYWFKSLINLRIFEELSAASQAKRAAEDWVAQIRISKLNALRYEGERSANNKKTRSTASSLQEIQFEMYISSSFVNEEE